MNSFIKRVRHRLRPPADDAPDPVGAAFHDDDHLISITDELLAEATHFIETGTYVGDTLRHVAERHPHLACHSCEPSLARFERATRYVEGLTNIRVSNVTSQEFIHELDAQNLARDADARPVFWLDAHGYGFEWPLRDEVRWATSFARGHVLIDDFEVPGVPVFGFDTYKEQTCTWSFIRDSLADRDDYRVTFPAYTEHTSRFHPLRGWVLLSFGPDLGDVLADNALVTHRTIDETDAVVAQEQGSTGRS